MKRYDTLEGIKTYLTDLEGLQELVRDRRAAYYQRKEHLNEFCILGMWWTDSCGNFGPIQKPPASLGKCPDVMTLADVTLFMRGEDFSWEIGASQVPPPYVVCEECRKPWGLRDCHDFICKQVDAEGSLEDYVGKPLSSVQQIPALVLKKHYLAQDSVYSDVHEGETRSGGNGKKWYYVKKDHVIQPGDRAMVTVIEYRHKTCSRLRQARQERLDIEEAFTKAGFPKANLISMENQYCPCDHCPPWFKVQVGERTPITVGWRKRVFKIDWADTKKDLSHLFENEEVTKEAHMIHAWGLEKLSEYLGRIIPAIEERP